MPNDPSSAESLPQFPESMWRATAQLPDFPRLEKNIETGVAVIGAGITGITTAYVLTKAGLKVTIVDAGVILDGTTGYTTAKITSQHGLIYDKLVNHFGSDAARLYFEANEEALRFISDTIKELDIDCRFEREDAYLYADSDEQLTKLQTEWKAYEKLELPGEWTETVPVPLEVKGAIVMRNQARFHPLVYLRSLVKYITEHGGRFYEHTTLEDFAEQLEGGKLRLRTENGMTITCSHAVSASHFPFFDGGGLYFTRLHAERSYVVAQVPEKRYPGGMYINCGEPKRSLRTAELDGKEVILVGGESHKTGKNDCTFERYKELEKFGRDTFGVKSIPYRWSNQDLVTIDEVPYIGRITAHHPNIYVATGFYKWGMTSSAVSAMLIRDLIMGQANRYESLFTPSRFKVDPGVKNFVTQNAEVAKEWVTGKIEATYLKADDLVPGQGGVIKHFGKRAGAYRDDEGMLYIVDTTCTHLGCELGWNDAEHSWDCPCHGSRFNYKGSVIEGPATDDLKPLNMQPRSENN